MFNCFYIRHLGISVQSRQITVGREAKICGRQQNLPWIRDLRLALTVTRVLQACVGCKLMKQFVGDNLNFYTFALAAQACSTDFVRVMLYVVMCSCLSVCNGSKQTDWRTDRQTDAYDHVDPEAKARASGSEREMGQARARENFSRSEREK